MDLEDPRGSFGREGEPRGPNRLFKSIRCDRELSRTVGTIEDYTGPWGA